MLIVLASPDALFRRGTLDQALVEVLKQARMAGYPTAVVSNHPQPHWFDAAFGKSGVQFIQEIGRQSGDIVTRNAKIFSLHSFDVLVLAVSAADIQMGKNGGALLVAGSWSSDAQVAALGVRVTSAQDFNEVIALTAGWPGHWWYSADGARYNVRALSDLSTKKYGLTGAQQEFARALTSTVKNGGPKLNALLAVTSRSLLMEGVGIEKHLVWGVYPSSKSSNDDSEVLSDFTHRLRTTVSRVRLAKKGEPVFIRHTMSSKRSAGGSDDRTDPSEQIQTIHLNPYYKQNGRLNGKHVVVIDDCTTYGVSFGVAAAFLRAAHAASVTGVALGKFGAKLQYYEIDITSDPFRPVPPGAFKIIGSDEMRGSTNASAQSSLQNLID